MKKLLLFSLITLTFPTYSSYDAITIEKQGKQEIKNYKKKRFISSIAAGFGGLAAVVAIGVITRNKNFYLKAGDIFGLLGTMAGVSDSGVLAATAGTASITAGLVTYGGMSITNSGKRADLDSSITCTMQEYRDVRNNEIRKLNEGKKFNPGRYGYAYWQINQLETTFTNLPNDGSAAHKYIQQRMNQEITPIKTKIENAQKAAA